MSADLRQVPFSRRSFLKALAALVGSGCVSTIGGYSYSTRVEPFWLAVEHVSVPIRNLHPSIEGFTIALLSDFHLYPYTKIDFIHQVVERTNQLAPDLVVFTGDYVLHRADAIFELAPVLAQINAPYGLFTILGNHDIWTNAQVVQQGLQEAGLPVLINAGVLLTVNKGQIYLAGLDDGWSGQPDLPRALEGAPPDVPVILLMHEPDFADEYAQDGRIALQLSGHSHGGQVRIPLVGAPILPPYGQKYSNGLYHIGTMWLYTNRGIGVIGPPVRFNCRPEITILTLVID
jgi:uncharacterized protein